MRPVFNRRQRIVWKTCALHSNKLIQHRKTHACRSSPTPCHPPCSRLVFVKSNVARASRAASNQPRRTKCNVPYLVRYRAAEDPTAEAGSRAVYRKHRVMISAAAAAVVGSLALLASTLWISWRESLTSEEVYAGGLAASLGHSAERMILDTRDMLAQLKDPGLTLCTPGHLRAMQEAGVSRPWPATNVSRQAESRPGPA